jgi:UDP-glucose 4-epimerase
VACIAITGLRTFLGRRLAERLASEAGVRVVGLDRLRPHGLTMGVQFREVDLTRPEAGSALADCFHKEDVDVVVHLAFRREPSPDLDADHELETIGSLHMLHACAAAGVPRLVVGSSTMVYGPYPDNPNFLSEEQPLRGHRHAHCVQNRVEMERLVGDWAARHPATTVTVLRPCWIVGPTYRDAVTRYFARPVVPTLMGYDPLLQFVHEEDCLDVFARAATGNHPGVYNVVAPGVLPLSTVLRSAGKRPLPVPAPVLVRLRAYPSQTQTGDRPEGFYDYLRYLWVADGRRGWEAFGRPLYSTREAWMAAISAERMRSYR